MSFYNEPMTNILFANLQFQIKYFINQKLFIVWIATISRETVKYEYNV